VRRPGFLSNQASRSSTPAGALRKEAVMPSGRSSLPHYLGAILLVLLSFAAFADSGDAVCSITAGSPEQTVTGTITDATGAPVPGALITAECAPFRRQVRSATNGTFSMAMPAGTLVVSVERAGFSPSWQRMTVAPDSAKLDVTLEIGGIEDSIVVTASGAEQTVKTAPASVSVVTREELEERPIRDLTDVIGTQEGVTLSRSGNLRTIQIRGLGSAYTLMLVDGRRVNSNSNMFRGNDFDSGWIPPDAIERVEVVRGPMSSLYGSDAIGGVVNIITRSIGDAWGGSVSADYALQENREAGDSYKGTFSLTGPLVRQRLGLKIYGTLDHREQDGIVNPPTSTGGTPLTGIEEKRNQFLNSQLVWQPRQGHEVSLSHHISDREHGGFTLKRQELALAHKGTWGAMTSDVKVYADQIRNLTGNVTGQTNPNKAKNASADARVTMPFARAQQILTIGAESRYQQLEDRTMLNGLPGTPEYGTDPTTSVTQHAFLAEYEVSPFKGFRMTVGNRMDRHENFGSHNSPRVYFVYTPNEHVTFKTGWATAFRAPTLLQNSPKWGSVSCGSATTGCYIVGSDLLEPETSTSLEAGTQLTFGAWSAGVTVFRNRLRDMIDITNRTRDPKAAPSYPNFVGFLPDGRPIFRYENIARVRSEGVEAGFRVAMPKNLALQANYTYTDAKNVSGVNELPLTYRPEHSGNVTLDWTPAGPLSLTLRSTYVGKQYINVPASGLNMITRSGYLMHDLSAGYQFTPGVLVRGGLLNALDEVVERDTADEFNEDGRRYFLSFVTRF
jgi:outer membrane receptor for ferrienterochelin and colicins